MTRCRLTASLRSAEADLAKAEADLSNLEDEADGSDSSDAQIEAAQSQVAVLQENVDDAEDAMDDAKARRRHLGPRHEPALRGGRRGLGRIEARDRAPATPAAWAAGPRRPPPPRSPGSVTIVGQDEWTVSVSLSEADVADIAEGDQVTFTSEDLDDEFFGVVSDIANLPTTTGGSATYAVELTVTGTVEGLYEGTSVEASIVTLRETDVLAVPANAITTTDGVSTVTVVADDGTTEEREVTTGETIGEYTTITDGLSEGEQIQMTVMQSGGTGTGDAEDMMQQFGGEMPTGGEMPDGMTFPGGGQMPGGQ
ncbi:efflux RND transporter periplasmic adaptor subunit [Demequina litorisediminis]|uniref:HlyD family secretion protein n=1 Tax=Demequina litorisediminis TaxID=1849022 RepID=A0ABQ6IH24_9MICO|nr:RND transporter [Demequina litorisediminis]GMA37085.1 hypothetical protein GCM10025876_32890 [Demequina litorisediminis]